MGTVINLLAFLIIQILIICGGVINLKEMVDISCEAGYYCPIKDGINQAIPCGLTPKHYCPVNHSHPLPTSLGYYATGFEAPKRTMTTQSFESRYDLGGFTSQTICPLGSYCIDGLKNPCPGGRYGISLAMTNSSCSGPCTEGHWCPEGSISPKMNPCGTDATVYCPRGSSSPLKVSTSYYTHGHERSKIDDVQKVEFFNMAATSRFCLALSGTPWKYAVCENGALSVTSTSIQIISYLQGLQNNEVSVSIPVFTATDGTLSFTVTFAGYERHVDMLVARKDVTAPPGAISRVTKISVDTDPLVGESFRGLRHTAQSLCEPGLWCDETTGRRIKCPAGRYGSETGLSSMRCSGLCAMGHYCPEGSVSKTQYACGGINLFCPQSSEIPLVVDAGYYTINGDSNNASKSTTHLEMTRAAQHICEPGSWCLDGVRRLCSPGYYGDKYGLVDDTCSGLCREGHICLEGSIKDDEIKCGDPNYYCLKGAWMPTLVSNGYYSIGGAADTRTGQTIAPRGKYAYGGLLFTCPAGFYGASEGLTTSSCSGPCVAGFFCPPGSTSPIMNACGSDDLFCPPKSALPIRVTPGFYTADYLYEECPPGKYRTNSSMWVDASLPGPSIIQTEAHKPNCQLCPEGKFKIGNGDSVSLCKPCDKFHNRTISSADRMTCTCLEVVALGYFMHFNLTLGSCTKIAVSDAALLPPNSFQYNISLTRSSQHECEPGHFCRDGQRFRCPFGTYGALQRETRPTCQGLCNKGYFCQEASISPFATPCGSVNLICPLGAYAPKVVPKGFYTVENGPESLRFESQICPKGYYCPGDGRKYICDVGMFGDVEGLETKDCSGICDRGYFCTQGSTSRRQNKCGGPNFYCPPGSSAPTRVSTGFYSVFTGVDSGAQQFWDRGNTTASAELPCEPGYYCNAGIKYPCPPGTFGWRYGDTSPACGGQCSAGYYCPSYLTPQSGAPSHTVWPGKPHTNAAELECGGVSFYCPRGSSFPFKVGAGNYTVGGTDIFNNTRTGQQPCIPGTFCENGIVNLCPKGRYGSSPSQSVSICTGWCPPGHFCPPGTSLPKPCEGSTYSVGSSWACSECPGVRTSELKCRDQRACCFRA